MINVVIGGTFNSLHVGHCQLLDKAFEAGDFVHIGLTSDEYCEKSKEFYVPYETRFKRLVNYLNDKEYGGRYLIGSINFPSGDAATRKDYDVIVVSEETNNQAHFINEERERNGLSSLKIIVVPLIMDERGNKISSTRIMKNIIDKNGNYLKRLKVTFLGTSGGMPSKDRQCMGILVENGKHAILLDCGDGIAGQLAKAGADINHIDAIFISHAHLDHYSGAPMLVLHSMMLYQRSKPILIYASKETISMLEPMFKNYRLQCPFEIIFKELETLACYVGGKMSVTPFPVSHDMEGAFGFQITDDEGRKIVYSGDTRPCENVINASKGADLLIHEATFASDHIKETHGHSRISDAIQVAKDAKVKCLMLTHISVRYLGESKRKEYVLETHTIGKEMRVYVDIPPDLATVEI